VNPTGQDYLGSTYPAPTDPNYYLSQVGLSSLAPQAFNADTLSAMFSPQGMNQTPINAQATNPFESLFLQSSQDATKLQRKQVPGMQMPAANGQQDPNQGQGQ
jgi:hypothetical protein